MNLLYSVRFRLFALCISLLVVLGGANVLLGGINQQHETQVLQLQEQYRRVSVIFSVHQAMGGYRYWQGQVNDAGLLGDIAKEQLATSRLERAKTVLEGRLSELAVFDSETGPELRRLLEQIGSIMRKAVIAISKKDPAADSLVAAGSQVANSIESLLTSTSKREQQAAADMESKARARAVIGERWSVGIIVISTAAGLLLTLIVLNSIIRPMQSTVRALRMVNAGEESIDLPPVTRDEFGDMAVALRQFRDQAERLRRLAYVDPLTGVGNRARLEEDLKEAISVAAQNSTNAALLFIDVDNFKAVNESLGHGAGDRYLCEASIRLQRFAPGEALLCRYGGDKFTALVPETPGWDPETLQDYLRKVAGSILQGMAEPVELGADLLPMSVSIGIAVFPFDGRTSEELISSAEGAMYLAKRHGRNKMQFANPETAGDARRQLATATEIRRGLENAEFEAFYQPVVNVLSGAVVGAEALIRWRHPQRGIVTAGEFVPAAEAAGLIAPLGEQCLMSACRASEDWIQKGVPLRVSVNLSARQIEDGTAVAFLRELHSGGLRRGAKELDFEITETAILQHLEQVQRTLQEIQDMGHHLSVDDFGTGYSSLVYLQRFPVNRIKIDRSFVARIDVSREAKAIVAATIALGQSLDLEVVAEGVETQSQLECLRSLGCVLQQGYFFTAALPAPEFDAWRAQRSGELLTA